MHLGEEWDGGVRWSDWVAYVGEGFAKRRPKRRRVGAGNPTHLPLPFVESSIPWSRSGTSSEPLFTTREPGFRHNVKNLPFASLPLVVMNDAFNCYQQSNKVSACISMRLRCLLLNLFEPLPSTLLRIMLLIVFICASFTI